MARSRAMFTGEPLPEVERVVFAAGDAATNSALRSVKLGLEYQRIDMSWTDGGTVSDDHETSITRPLPASSDIVAEVPPL